MIVACYAFSLLVVERLFKIVKPKLLTISWFAKLWNGLLRRERASCVFSGVGSGCVGLESSMRRRRVPIEATPELRVLNSA